MSQSGRPRLLDETKQSEICALISAGCGYSFAARYVGCTTYTIRRESLRNDDFDRRLRRACLAAQLTPLNALRNSVSKHWRAAAWFLERNDPDQFAKRGPRTVTPEHLDVFVGQILEIVYEELTDPRARRRLRRRFQAYIRDVDRRCIAGGSGMRPMPAVRRRRRKEAATAPAPVSMDSLDLPAHVPQTASDHHGPS